MWGTGNKVGHVVSPKGHINYLAIIYAVSIVFYEPELQCTKEQEKHGFSQ